MLQPLSVSFLAILIVLICYRLLADFFSRDKALIWSPLTFIAGTLIYYVVFPSISSMKGYSLSGLHYQWAFYLSALLFYVCVLIGFGFRFSTRSFSRWNTYYNNNNALVYGISLFVIAVVCYVPFRGFRTTVWDSDSTIMAARTGFVSYFIDLISILCASCGLLFMKFLGHKRSSTALVFLLVLYLTFTVYIVGGFRFRLVYLIVLLFTIYHLYLGPRRLNLVMVASIAIPIYLLFAAMDYSRNYGAGLSRDAIEGLSIKDVKSGARENASVLYFSALCTDSYYHSGDLVGFEPIYNALLMPFPRTVFPWKPDGEYMRRAQIRTLGTAEGGAAFLNFTEGFISFGWLGVILYGLFMGLLSKLFWQNYCNNKDSMAAVLLLALYNGFCYQWISRGYLGGNFNSFLYYVIVPFWLSYLIKFISNRAL